MPMVYIGDAIGNDVLAVDRILKEAGFQTAVYAERSGPGIPKGVVFPVSDLHVSDEKDIILYHASTGSGLSIALPRYGGKKVMVYHNITPPRFFHGYHSEAEHFSMLGYDGIRYLSDRVDYCIADSEYNRQELLRMGYRCPVEVCPVVIPFEDYRQEADRRVLRQYGEGGWTNVLFVGRVVPNKKQEDVIRAFSAYHRYYNRRSRLFFVGNSSGMQAYVNRLREYAGRLQIADRVIFPGHISFREVLAYYQAADVFLCMSEHEGFCVPLLEAMSFRVPIVAYRSTAIPETLGQGGILLDTKEPRLAAAAMNRVMTDDALRAKILASQKKQLRRYRYPAVKKRLLQIMEKVAEL